MMRGKDESGKLLEYLKVQIYRKKNKMTHDFMCTRRETIQRYLKLKAITQRVREAHNSTFWR